MRMQMEEAKSAAEQGISSLMDQNPALEAKHQELTQLRYRSLLSCIPLP